MKYALLLLPLLLIGCEKKEDGRRSGLPRMASGTITTYQGVITPAETLYIPVDGILGTTDAALAYLCMNAICDADALPAFTCAEAGHLANHVPGWQTTAVCYTSSPSPFVSAGTLNGSRVVAFTNNPFQEGFRTYAIKTIVYH